MENSFTVIRDDDESNEEWSSFCSSCKSILQATYSTGEPSFLNNDDIKETKLNQEFYEKENFTLLNTLEYNEILRNLMSSERSQNKTNNNTRKNILDHRRKIVKLTKSILHLSNCINVMRTIILEEIHKKSKDTMSRFCYSHN